MPNNIQFHTLENNGWKMKFKDLLTLEFYKKELDKWSFAKARRILPCNIIRSKYGRGYYHIGLTPYASCLCTDVIIWGKYEYLRLPMGFCNSPDIFQEKMIELMFGLEFSRA
jgi:hypothetical protein